MLKISPALIKDLEKVLNAYGFKFKHSALNNLNKATENHRHIFSDGNIKLLIEFKKEN
jgi:hypothetical protein